MKYVHIITVGTGIIGNLAMDTSLEENLRSKFKAWAFSRPKSPEDVEAGEAASKGRYEFKVAYEKLLQDPRRYSPELNAMWDYLARKEVDFVHLITTDSGELLKHILKNKEELMPKFIG